MSEIAMTGWEILDEARAMLRAAVAGCSPGGRPGRARRPARNGPPPRSCSTPRLTSGCGGPPWPDARPADNPFAPSGQLGTEPVAYADRALAESAPGWASVGQEAGPVPTPLPQGEMEPARAAGAAAWMRPSTPGTSR